jgi:hypothetical protein
VLHLLADDGGRVELPVAFVSDRNPDRTLETIRSYHSMRPLTGGYRVREPLLPQDPNLVVPASLGRRRLRDRAGHLRGGCLYSWA